MLATEPSELLTRQEAAKFLGLAEGTLAVWQSTKRYDLPCVKLGARSVRYRRADLEAFINRGVNGGEAK